MKKRSGFCKQNQGTVLPSGCLCGRHGVVPAWKKAGRKQTAYGFIHHAVFLKSAKRAEIDCANSRKNQVKLEKSCGL
jgi:hypothetical protein